MRAFHGRKADKAETSVAARQVVGRVLGIETSCDETGVAVYDADRGLLAHRLYSQIALHESFGGVVPELASRDHIRKLSPLVKEVLAAADSSPEDIDAVAYTQGPGLVGALMVGACFGRALAYGWGVPALGVHHMEGHLLAPMLETDRPEFPFIALLVSGGHTQLVRVDGVGQYKMLGESLDDAAGEAFDKTAKMLGLGYPGGPLIEKAAAGGDPRKFDFPRPMKGRPGCDFSFSGLKTSVRRAVETLDGPLEGAVADLAASFQTAVAETLVARTRNAIAMARETHPGIETLVVAGGVAANRAIGSALDELAGETGMRLVKPAPALCTDNGAMIAWAGLERFRLGQTDPLDFKARPRWPLDPDAPAAAFAGVKA